MNANEVKQIENIADQISEILGENMDGLSHALKMNIIRMTVMHNMTIESSLTATQMGINYAAIAFANALSISLHSLKHKTAKEAQNAIDETTMKEMKEVASSISNLMSYMTTRMLTELADIGDPMKQEKLSRSSDKLFENAVEGLKSVR